MNKDVMVGIVKFLDVEMMLRNLINLNNFSFPLTEYVVDFFLFF